jgi:hypothetical protein
MAVVAFAGVLMLDPGAPHPKMTLVGDSGQTVIVPFAPQSLAHDGFAGNWDTVARLDQAPLVRRHDPGIETITFTLSILGDTHQDPIEDVLAQLVALARSGERVTINYGPQESGLWRLTAFSYQVTERRHGTNEITQADAPMTFTQASDTALNLSPLTGGAANHDVAASNALSTGSVKP